MHGLRENDATIAIVNVAKFMHIDVCHRGCGRGFNPGRDVLCVGRRDKGSSSHIRNEHI